MNSKTSYSKKYGAICILDALGTKGIWKQKDPENVIQNWERFVTTIENNIIKNDKGIEYSLYAFSDTLIITASGKLSLEKLLFGLSVHLATLVAFGFPQGIFLRGCISIGTFYESKKMILGPAIDEAAQYYELADWIGVHLTPSAFSAVDRLYFEKESTLTNSYKLYSVPLNTGRTLNTYALAIYNYDLKKVFDPNGTDKVTPMLEEERTVLDFIHYRLEHLEDVEGSDKWKNTLDFIKFMIKGKNSKLKSDPTLD